MQVSKFAKITTLVLALSSLTIFPSSALSENLVQPTSTFKARALPNGTPITPAQLKMIQSTRSTLKFLGTECLITNLSGCTVTRSENVNYPVGYVFRALASAKSSNNIAQTAFNAGCSWCGFIGESIGIILFVASAPASTPTFLIISTYAIGVGIILNHA